jgi:hypothetical protein
VDEVRLELYERCQDKSPKMHARMRNLKTGFLPDAVFIQEEVQVENPCRPFFPLSRPPTGLLNLQEDLEEGRGGKGGLDLHHPVEKPVTPHVDRLRLVKGGGPQDADLRRGVEQRDGSLKMALTISEVRADTDIGPTHP